MDRVARALSCVLGKPAKQMLPSTWAVPVIDDGGPWRPAVAALGDEGITSPAEAWMSLATNEVIPFDWVSNPRRGFWRGPPPYCSHGQKSVHIDPAAMIVRCKICKNDWPIPQDHVLEYPSTIFQCVVIASQVEIILAAEAVASECGKWLSTEQRIVWRLGETVQTWDSYCFQTASALRELGCRLESIDRKAIFLSIPEILPMQKAKDTREIAS